MSEGDQHRDPHSRAPQDDGRASEVEGGHDDRDVGVDGRTADLGRHLGVGLGAGVAVGIGLGAAAGVLLDNPALGIGPGIAIGSALGLAYALFRSDR